MNKILLLIVLFFFFSCKKEEVKTIKVSRPKVEVLDNKSNRKSIVIDTAQIQKFKSKLLSSFYESNSNKTVWLSTSQRETIISTLNHANEDGLDSKDYAIKTLTKYEKKKNTLSNQEWITYDLTLTNSLQKYISHLANGKLNPRILYTDWDLKENEIDINKTIFQLRKSDSIVEKIEELKPNHIVYTYLKKALQIINRFPKDNFKRIEIDEKITPKDTNSIIVSIKKRLIFWKDLKTKDSLTSVYDPETVKAVVKFQIRHGLAPDGIIGKGTVSAFNYSKKQRQEQIIVNLERWKWFPRKFKNEHLIINIPDYKLSLTKGQDTIRSHKVIVGRSARKTPILSSKLSYVVFNPTWTVPPTILKEDVIPAILKSRSYLTSTNILVYDGNGAIVNPNDWELPKAKSYRYVQTPGTYNSLGMVKIIFPNRFSVYLHDTNHRDFFIKTNRSLSSGCVRLENPFELTEYLLDDSINWDLEQITETLKTNKTKYVNLKKDIFIHLLYWTAWSDKNQLIFRDDIYNLDSALYHQLRN